MKICRIDCGRVIGEAVDFPRKLGKVLNPQALTDTELNAIGYARAVIPDYDPRFQEIWNGDVITSSASRPELIDGKAVFVASWKDLPTCKLTATAVIYEICKAYTNDTAKMYSEYEAARWTKLVDECQMFLSTGRASTFMLVASVDDSQEGLTTFANEVLAKAVEFETFLAQTRKWRELKLIAIDSAITTEEVKAIVDAV